MKISKFSFFRYIDTHLFLLFLIMGITILFSVFPILAHEAHGNFDKEVVHEDLQLSSKYAFLMDANTGTVLFEKNADVPMAPSSMSKIVTTYIIFEKLKRGELTLETLMPVSEKAWRQQGTRMFVELGSQIKLGDLLRGIIVQSGNDACIVVAEALSGTEENFARLMTQKAHELGATSSHFTNSSGWEDAGHVMTARDIAVIALRTIQDFPEYYHYYKEIDFTYNNIKQGNRNPLLYIKNMGADGLKTGHTDAGGFGLVASVIRNGRRLIMVINGAETMKERAKDAEVLINWGFREYGDVTFAKPGQVLEEVPVWLGVLPKVGIQVQNGATVTVRTSEKDKVKAELLFESPLKAPIDKNMKIGEMKITFPNGDSKNFPLNAVQDVSEVGFFGKIWARVKSMIPGLS